MGIRNQQFVQFHMLLLLIYVCNKFRVIFYGNQFMDSDSPTGFALGPQDQSLKHRLKM